MPRLSYDQRRAGAGVALAVMILGIANYYLRWGLFGGAARQALVVGAAAGVAYAMFVGPTPDEIRAEQQRRRGGRRP